MIRVAAYQAAAPSTYSDRKAKILHLLEEADRQQIDFLCFPEGFLTRYYKEKELAEENALEAKEFQNWPSFHVTAIIGFVERLDDHLYDSAAVIEKGQLLGIQRKHFLYHNYFTSHNQFHTFQSKDITFGVVICLDTNYFEPSRLLALQGAAILFSPQCNKVPADHPLAHRPSYYSHFVARTHENRCWLISSDWIWPNSCPGHTTIYDPDGREIARSSEGCEQWLIYDIPKERLFHKKGLRVAGSAELKLRLSSHAIHMDPS